jgi:hypothetical protein
MLDWRAKFVLSIDLCFETANIINDYQTGSVILTAITVKSYIVCDIKPCNPFKINRRFGDISKVEELAKQEIITNRVGSCLFLAWITLLP